MTREKQIEILMEDRCTKSEAEKHLKNGTTIFEDFEENFDKYMEEWKYLAEDEEEYNNMVESYRNMIETGDRPNPRPRRSYVHRPLSRPRLRSRRPPRRLSVPFSESLP